MAGKSKLQKVRSWVPLAMPGDEIVYHSGLNARRTAGVFELMRELSEDGLVLLFQRRVKGEWTYCAMRTSARGGRFIKWVSSLTPAPHNPHAYGASLSEAAE